MVKVRMRRILKFTGWYLVFSTVAAIGMLIHTFPNYPKSLGGWAWFFFLALPVTLIGEAIGEAARQNPIAKDMEDRMSKRSFLWLRICYGFAVILMLFGFAWGMSFYFPPH
jgi:hypothetical protein